MLRKMNSQQTETLLVTLQKRFDDNPHRHVGLAWDDVAKRLADDSGALSPLQAMEATGGEPDVIGRDDETGAYIFCDCAKESPLGRRNLCYDGAALLSRKANRPESSAMDMAAEMGIALLTEAQYRTLQALEKVDAKTSSWIVTPDPIRALGGALFCDRRYDHVFTYHNGAESYYGARGFRGMLRV